MEKPHPPGFRDAPSDFLEEGSPGDQDELERGLVLLSHGLLPARPRVGAERIRSAVAELPVCYAPFYARLAELWRMPEARVEAELGRARDARTWASTPLPGLCTFLVDVGQVREAERARLLRFAPGARFPRHQHRGSERVLVLEGSYADSSGCVVGPGQEQRMAEGSEHELRILGDVKCVAAVVEQGIDFSSPWLRLASRFVRR